MTPIYSSLLHPVTLAGINEEACYLIWFSILVSMLGAGQWWVLPFGLLMHGICLMVTRIDEQFFHIAMKSMRYPEFFSC